jgi:hypothetical protein
MKSLAILRSQHQQLKNCLNSRLKHVQMHPQCQHEELHHPFSCFCAFLMTKNYFLNNDLPVSFEVCFKLQVCPELFLPILFVIKTSITNQSSKSVMILMINTCTKHEPPIEINAMLNRQPKIGLVQGVLGNKNAGQHNLKTVQIREIMWK